MSLKVDKLQLDIIINGDQTRKELMQLENRSKQLAKELKKLPEGSDEFIKKSAEFKQVQNRMDELKNKIGLTGMTIKELQKRQQELNLVFKNMDPRLPQYKLLEAEINQVKGRLAELQGRAQQTGFSLKGLADGFNRYFAIVTAGLASVTGLIFSFRKLVDVSNEYEKKLDNLSALTGLQGDDMDWLSQKAKELSTSMVEGNVRITQSADTIVDAYTKVGSARPELLKNKELLNDVTKEAIILANASDGVLQPAVDGLTMMLNQFNAPASDARRIINAMAAGSKEGAGEIPYLTQAVEKSGTVAADVKMSYEDLIGTIETLAPRITQPEIAGRTLKGVILDLQKTADETNPAVVGFATAIENLGKKNLSTVALMKIFGSENITAAKILINNQAETKRYTEAVTGTNVAIEQAAINTDNNSSKLAQAKNRVQLLSIELGNKLAPALTFSTNGFSYLMKAILGTINFFHEYRSVILASLASVATYTIAVYAVAAAKKDWTFVTDKLKTSIQGLNAATKANFIVAIASAAVGLITYLATLRKKTDELTEAQIAYNNISKSTQKILTEESTHMNLLFDALQKEKVTREEKIKLIKHLNEEFKNYLPNLLTEKSTIDDIKKAQKEANAEMERKIVLEVRERGIRNLIEEKTNLEDLNKGYQVYIETLKKVDKQYEDRTDLSNFQINQAKKKNALYQQAIGEMPSFNTESPVVYYQRKIEENNKKIETSTKMLESTKNEYNKTLSEFGKNEDKPATGGGNDEAAKKAADKALKIQNELYKSRLDITKDGMQKEILVIQQGLSEQLALWQTEKGDSAKEISAKEEIRRNITTKANKDILAIRGRYFADEMQKTEEFLTTLNDLTEKEYKGLSKQIDESAIEVDLTKGPFVENMTRAYEIITENHKKSRDERIKQLEEEYRNGAISYQEYIDKLRDIQSEFTYDQDKTLKAMATAFGEDFANIAAAVVDAFNAGTISVQNIANAVMGVLNTINNQQTQQENNQLQKDTQNNEKKKQNLKKRLAAGKISQADYDNAVAKLDDELDKKKKKIEHDQAVRAKRLHMFSAIIGTATAVINALQTQPFILGIILAALAAAMGAYQIATISKEPIPQAAKGRYKVIGADDGKTYNANYSGVPQTGLYTTPTIVAESGNEIIIDAPTTRNLMMNYPEVVDAINYARVPQRAAGKYPDMSSSTGSTQHLSVTAQMDPEYLEALKEFNENVKKGFRAKLVYSEFEDFQKDIESVRNEVKIKKNA